ncbi:MAG: hypothetical protein O2894_06205 [Planctomycetota bacterium]|nr:hypothetical protein [Planctomycetota bacterium]
MTSPLLDARSVQILGELFTRTYMSAATYAFESQPYRLPHDASLLERIDGLRKLDRDHATLLASALRTHDLVPEPGVFPYWYRDLNYLTVPFIAGFVTESLETDLAVLDRGLNEIPESASTLRALLAVMRTERAAVLAALAPETEAAQQREDQAYAEASATLRAAREARLAAEKAAEAARKDAERQRKAAELARAAPPTAVPPAAAPSAAVELLDPNEPGITGKEKARRTMLIKRAEKAGATPLAPPAPAAAERLDPSEPGITAKEKARRTMLIKRAEKAGAAPAAAVPAPVVAPAPELADPDEPGISAKEKARRTMMIKRAQQAAAAPAAVPAPADAPQAAPPELLDPDEPGISAKERARRTMMIKRAGKQAP